MIRKLAVSLSAALPSRIRAAVEASYYIRLLSRFPLEREPDLCVALQMLKPGDTVVDIGASIGLWTVNLARRVGATGQTIAVEPIPTTFAILKRVVDRLAPDKSDVVLHNCAISNESGKMGMEIPRDDRKIRNHYLARVVSGQGEMVVDMRKLDDICAAARGRIRLIKIDTEGHELAVIQGGLRTLRDHLPVLCIEISTDTDDPATEGGQLIQRLKELGYSCHIRHNGRLEARGEGETAVNYFFLPPNRAPLP